MDQFILFYNLLLSREKKCLQGPNLHVAASLGGCNVQDTEVNLSTLAIRSSHQRGAPELGLPMATPGAVHGLGFNFSLCDVKKNLSLGSLHFMLNQQTMLDKQED